MGQDSPWKAWGASAATILFCTFYGVAGLYPNLLPSSIDSAASMNITNSSSSPLTLKIMLGVALVMVPIVIIYQAVGLQIFQRQGDVRPTWKPRRLTRAKPRGKPIKPKGGSARKRPAFFRVDHPAPARAMVPRNG